MPAVKESPTKTTVLIAEPKPAEGDAPDVDVDADADPDALGSAELDGEA